MAVLACQVIFQLQITTPPFSWAEAPPPSSHNALPTWFGWNWPHHQVGLHHLFGLHEWFRDGQVHRTEASPELVLETLGKRNSPSSHWDPRAVKSLSIEWLKALCHYKGSTCLGLKPKRKKDEPKDVKSQIPDNTFWTPGSSQALMFLQKQLYEWTHFLFFLISFGWG